MNLGGQVDVINLGHWFSLFKFFLCGEDINACATAVIDYNVGASNCIVFVQLKEQDVVDPNEELAHQRLRNPSG